MGEGLQSFKGILIPGVLLRALLELIGQKNLDGFSRMG
jgi:hypothetical protein